MLKDIRKMLKQEIKQLQMDLVEKGITKEGRFDLYQSYDIIPDCTLGFLLGTTELRIVLYNNQYDLNEDTLIYRDVFRFSYIWELLEYGNSISTIMTEIITILYEELEVYSDGQI